MASEQLSNHLTALLEQGLVWRSGVNQTAPSVSPTTASSSPAGSASSTSTQTSEHSRLQKKNRAEHFTAQFGISEHDPLHAIDAALPCQGLAFGCLHQWSLTHALTSKEKHHWHAPLFLLSTILGRSLGKMPYATNPIARGKSIIVWIGKRCWPTPQLLEQNITWQSEIASGGEVAWPWKSRSVFIDPASKDARLWSATQALKNPSVFAVVTDCSGFDLHAMRRLQLAAEFGNSLGLAVRPPWEEHLPSAAHTKWRVSPLPSENDHMVWNLELLVAKGVASMPHQLSKKLVEKLSSASNLHSSTTSIGDTTPSQQAIVSAIKSRQDVIAGTTLSESNSAQTKENAKVDHTAPATGLDKPQYANSSSEVPVNGVPVNGVPMKNQMQWFIEWNEESNYGKGALRFATQPREKSVTGTSVTGRSGERDIFSKTG